MNTTTDRTGARFEWMSLDELAEHQSRMLRETGGPGSELRDHGARLREEGIDLCDIDSRDDVVRLPFTTKEDLRLSYPAGCSRSNPSRSCACTPPAAPPASRPPSSTPRGHRLLGRAYGAMPGDGRRDPIRNVFQNMSGYGLFTGGLGLHYGAERLGMWVIPAGRGQYRPPDHADPRLPRHLSSTPPRATPCTWPRE